MKKILKKIKEDYFDRFFAWYRRSFLLKNKDFSIISNNCWGGRVYQRYNLPYTSPTVGLLFFAEDYIKFVKNIHYYLSLDLQFIPKAQSKYIEKFSDKEKYCPIGILGDIEVIFLHYSSENEAQEKWNRRKQRINWENLIVKFNDQNACNSELIREFDCLPFKNKICFIANPVPETKCTVLFTEDMGKDHVVNDVSRYTRYLKITKWLNNHKGS